MTQEELGKQLGIDATSVSHLERGKMIPRLEVFAAMVRLMRLSPRRLLDEYVPKRTKPKNSERLATITDISTRLRDGGNASRS